MTTRYPPAALFRLSVLGPLASREQLARGELKCILTQLASQTYHTPQGKTLRLTEKTIERWYYEWKKKGIDGLIPKIRQDKGVSQLAEDIQLAILDAKNANQSRSINTLIKLLELQGLVAKNQLSRSSVHRLLKQHNASQRSITQKETIERRAFEAEHVGDLWYGDVMHGPRIQTPTGIKKVYLVTAFDDTSRLACHSCFCFNETALSIEFVLKEALLKRGLPKKLMVDNGPAYRSDNLQASCARLKIRLIYSRPYEPESKGKLERWHRTIREQFLSELDIAAIHGLDALNARLWAWLETVYHQTPHASLGKGITPLIRYQQELQHIQPLGKIAENLDDYFYHRVKRCVKKDGTVSYEGNLYEVDFVLASTTVYLVVNPHEQLPKAIESADGQWLSNVVALDKQGNLNRKRHRPNVNTQHKANTTSLVELVHEKAKKNYDITQ